MVFGLRVMELVFVAPYTANNNWIQVNPALYGIQDAYDIKADKTFTLTDRSRAVIQRLSRNVGLYSGTDLTLKYDDWRQRRSLTYDDSTPSKPLLKFPVAMDSDTLINPTTRQREVVRHNFSLFTASRNQFSHISQQKGSLRYGETFFVELRYSGLSLIQHYRTAHYISTRLGRERIDPLNRPN